MTEQWIVYQSTNAPLAAQRLRDLSRDAVCVMQFDRRSPSRWVKPKSHEDAPKRVAWDNHLFVKGRIDRPTKDAARVKIWEVQFAGRPGFLQAREAQLLFDADALWRHPKGKFWLDCYEDEARERWRRYIRAHRKDQLARHQYSPGQRIRFEFAAQRIEREILDVKGGEVEVCLSLLGVERLRIPVGLVERVA